jgi:hypothetical protein
LFLKRHFGKVQVSLAADLFHMRKPPIKLGICPPQS